MTYENECYSCGQIWESEMSDESCPECGENNSEKIQTYSIEDY